MNDASEASTQDEGNARSEEILSHSRETDYPTGALTRTGNPIDIESEGNARDENIESSDRQILLTNGEAETPKPIEPPEISGVIEERVIHWFKEVHNAISGHNGVDETMRRLFELPKVRTLALRGRLPKELVRWVGMLVRFCPTCMKSSFRKPDVVAAHFSCSSYVKMNRIAIDYIESLRADGKGNDMIIVIIYCFLRWVSLTAVQSKSGGTFADAYIAWLGLCFGEPKEILTDRGAQFTSNLTEQLTAVTGGRMIFTTAGSKQENAIVERANREVIRHLRNVIMDRRAMDEWSDTYHSSKG